jgi:hypothetical protein
MVGMLGWHVQGSNVDTNSIAATAASSELAASTERF